MDFLDIRLKLRSIFRPMRATLDSNDNSVSINESLYKAMLACGIEDSNHILTFKAGDRYAFTVNPTGIKETSLSALQVNSQYHTIGFELLTPSVNTIMYHYGLPFGTVLKNARVKYRRIGEYRCFVFAIK